MKLHFKLNNENDIYYNCKYCYSYNAFLSLIDGGRGIGKTTTFLIDALKQVEKGKEFIYLRRYKSEVKEFVNKDTIGAIIDEDVVYKGDGNGGYTILIENNILGYIVPLSTARSYKSVRFDKVSRILFDEAIVMEGPNYRYLKNEITLFLEFVSTVVRTRLGVKVVLIGNNEDLFNPYYRYFNIPIFENTYNDNKRGIFCQHAKNSEKLMILEQKTELHSLIKDTAYGDYHYGNHNLQETRDIIIKPKPDYASLLFRLEMNNQTLNVYTFNTQLGIGMYIEHRNKLIDDNITYHILHNGEPNYYYIDLFKKKLKNYVQKIYYSNCEVYYNDAQAGALFKWVLKEV